MSKRARRTLTVEFKRQAVELVTKQGYSPAEAARSLDIGEGLLRKWQRAIEAEQTPAASAVLEEQLRRLREENRRLKMERDILEKPRNFSVGMVGHRIQVASFRPCSRETGNSIGGDLRIRWDLDRP